MSTGKNTDVEDILNRLKFAKKLKTWKQVADYLGEKEGTISAWKARKTTTVIEKILYRSREDVDGNWLLTGEGEMNPEKKTTLTKVTSLPKEKPAPFLDNNIAPAPLPSYKSRQIPVISFVQAGEWTEAVDLFQPGFADDWVVTAETDCPYAFALKVVGDSMEPKFQEGDIIVVDPEKQYVSGSYVIAKNGDEATFKQLILDPPQTFLKPLNERYPIRDMTGKNLRIVGVVVERKTKF